MDQIDRWIFAALIYGAVAILAGLGIRVTFKVEGVIKSSGVTQDYLEGIALLFAALCLMGLAGMVMSFAERFMR